MIERVTVNIAGLTATNPDRGAWGGLIRINGKKEVSGKGLILPDQKPNPTIAAFEGILWALKHLEENHYLDNQVRVYCDDLPSIRFLNRLWKPKPDIIEAYREAIIAAAVFEDLKFTWIAADENGEAIYLARQSLAEHPDAAK